jgi:N-acetylneuraminate lyase
MKPKFEGIYPAVLTPFSGPRALDLDAFGALVDRLYAEGVDGIYVGGNTGEWYLQSLEERKTMARAAVELSRGKGRVLLHVGCLVTEDALDLARFAEQIGVDAVSSLPPYVVKWSPAEVIHFYRRLCEATALPCFVYYFPALTGSSLGESFFDSLRSLNGIAGFKFTDMNLYELGNMAERAGDQFTVLNGHDQVLLPGLTMGAHGGIGSFYNVLAAHFVALYRAFRAGDLACARARQQEINRVIRVVKRFRLVPALKSIAGMQGVDLGVCREPTLALSPDEQQLLADELAALSFALA